MRYFKFPKWLKHVYPDAIWDFFSVSTQSPTIYLTFDDGPNPGTTEWILNLLNKYNAKATFFCLGENVINHPILYQKLINNGHTLGNHGFSHLNGVHTASSTYLADVEKAGKVINSDLFRPPYGKLKPSQFKKIKNKGLTTVFWSYITYDFDASLDTEKRLNKALKHVVDGSIVVFHDSDKAFPQLKKELPKLLEHWVNKNYEFKAIQSGISPFIQ